jgi:hypothetical protein
MGLNAPQQQTLQFVLNRNLQSNSMPHESSAGGSVLAVGRKRSTMAVGQPAPAKKQAVPESSVVVTASNKFLTPRQMVSVDGARTTSHDRSPLTW